MKHSIDGINNAETITISELENTIEIVCYNEYENEKIISEVELDVDSLYSFIGTLLHVQQRLKNK